MAGGLLEVVSLGPGDAALLTPQCREALASAQLIVGYRRYLDLVPPELAAGKELLATGMTGEMERAGAALDAARSGRRVAVVSSGDAGVYAMAGLVLELAAERGLLGELDIRVLPGVPALAAAAALLGAPLTHDFACVSLSDLMTPWAAIERRLEAAVGADFVLVIYNPRSRKRDWQLPRALEIVARLRGPRTPVGLVRNAFRPGQAVLAAELADLDPAQVDMLSILVVGNSATRLAEGRMITPRGYLEKYGSGAVG
ncbi:MAG: precorrin-3B C(17)-methyltransferase [Thermodesulfobacteriota bacterium]